MIKRDVLRMLEERRGTAISGEAMAQALGVSRAAVCKAVASLRAEGHLVGSAPHRGYLLERGSDVLTEEGIRSHLSEAGGVRRVVCLETVDSTNTHAKRLALAGAESGTLIAANHQTAGRGRRGRSFLSPAGTGLYMTLLLRPSSSMERFQMITVAAGTAVCLAVEELTPLRPMVKWVNDVYLRGRDGVERKVCGILSEAVSDVESGTVENVAVGIGLNVTTQDFGPDLNDRAGSIFPEGVSRNQLAARIAERLMDFSTRLEDPELLRAYRERSLLLGRRVRWMQDGRCCLGRAVDVDELGGLVVEDEDGARRSLRSGEVYEVRPFDGAQPSC